MKAKNPRQQALLALKKKLSGIIVQHHAADPAGAAQGQEDAHAALAGAGGAMPPVDEEDMADGGADEAAEGEDPSNPVHSAFADYMKTKPMPRRPGTGMVEGGAMHGGAHSAPPKPGKRKGMV